MKKFIYVIATGKRPELMIGTCSDLSKAVKIFKDMPTVDVNPPKLVYAELAKDEAEATGRFNEIFSMSREQKEAMITNVNPNWIELVLGVNFDLK